MTTPSAYLVDFYGQTSHNGLVVDQSGVPTLVTVNAGGQQVLTTLASSSSTSSIMGLIANTNTTTARNANAAIFQSTFAVAGKYLIPAGRYYTAPFTVTAPCTITGCGSDNSYGPVSGTSTSTVGQVFGTSLATDQNETTMTILSPTVSLEGFQIVNLMVANPTSGSGIQVGTGTYPTVTPADGFKMYNVSLRGQYIPLDMVACVGYMIEGNTFYDPVQYGIRLNNANNVDESDGTIVGNQIVTGYRNVSGGVKAAIFIGSGGGVKILGNKSNSEPPTNQPNSQFNCGVWIQIKPINGVTDTGCFLITGNSWEGLSQLSSSNSAALFVDNSQGGNVVWGLTFQGNEAYSRDSSAYLAIITGSSAHRIAGVNITGNTTLSLGGGVVLQYTDATLSGANTHKNMGFGGFGTDSYVSNTNYRILPDTYIGALISDYRDTSVLFGSASSTDNHAIGNNDLTYTREIPATNIATTYTGCYTFKLARNSTARLRIQVAGNASGVGGFISTYDRIVTNNGSGVVTVVTGPTADYSSVNGTASTQVVDSQFNVTASDALTFNLRGASGVGLTTGNPGVLNGQIKVELVGQIGYVTRL